MAIVSVKFIIFLALSFLISISHSSILDPVADLTSATAISAADPPLFSTVDSSAAPQQPPQYSTDHAIFSYTSHLAPILSHLGFNELATAAPSLSSDSSTATGAMSGPPYTIFAPSDSSVRTCVSCSTASLLREHMIPGLFTSDYLRKLTFGTKIETLSPGRCITVTSTAYNNNKNFTTHKTFIGGVEITHPDLFNNGLIIIHGLQGYLSPLSPFSCDVERMASLAFPYDRSQSYQLPQAQQQNVALMRFMLRDAIIRLRNNGFFVLSLAMKIKYAELVPLNNVTIFALDDLSIFTGSYSYVNNVRSHVVPNQFLTMADLESLPVGTTLTTLDRGQNLVVTTAGNYKVRINYVRIKVAEVVRNLNVIVHSIYLPFPHLHPMAAVSTDPNVSSGGRDQTSMVAGIDGDCEGAEEKGGGCGLRQSMNNVLPADQVKPHVPEIEDYHGL